MELECLVGVLTGAGPDAVGALSTYSLGADPEGVEEVGAAWVVVGAVVVVGAEVVASVVLVAVLCLVDAASATAAWTRASEATRTARTADTDAAIVLTLAV